MHIPNEPPGWRAPRMQPTSPPRPATHPVPEYTINDKGLVLYSSTRGTLGTIVMVTSLCVVALAALVALTAVARTFAL